MASLSLHAYLARLFWICISPLLLLLAVFAVGFLQQIQFGQERDAENLASNVAASIDRQLKSRVGGLHMLASSPLMRQRECWQELYEEAQGYQRAFDAHVVLGNASGEMLMNTRVPFGTVLPPLPKVEGRSALAMALATGQAAVGDTFIGPVAQERMIVIAVPVRSGERVSSVIMTTLEARFFQQRLEEFALPSGWEVVLADSQGTAIARRSPDHDPGQTETGRRFSSRLKNADWTVTVVMPDGWTNTLRSEVALVLCLLIVAAALAGFVGGRLASRRLSRDLGRLGTNPPASSPGQASDIVEIESIHQRLGALEAEQRQSASMLAESERRLRLAQDAAQAGTWEWEVASGENFWSDEAFRLYGYEPGKCAASFDNWLLAIHPEDRDYAAQALEEAARQGTAIMLEWRVNSLEARQRWLMARGQPQFDAGGRLVRYLGIVMDISDRKQAEQAHAASEKRFQDIVEASADWVWEIDLEGCYTSVSDGVEAMLGFAARELVGCPYYELLPPGDAEASRARFADIVALKSSFRDLDNIKRHKSGQWRYVQTSGTPIFGPRGELTGYRGVDRDVTARRQTELALREREAVLQLFIEFAPVSIAMFDREMRYLAVSRHWRDDYALGDREMVGKSHYEIFPEITEAWKEVHRLGLAGEVVRQDEDCFMRADGRQQWIRWEVRPWRAASDAVGGILIFSEDITARKRAEIELHNSKERLRTLVTAIPDLVWLKSPSGYYLTCNTRFEQFFGAPEAEIVGKSDYDYVDKALADFFRASDLAAIEAGKPTMNEEVVVFASDGHHELLQTIKTPIFDVDGQVVGVLGVGRDITHIRESERELEQYRDHLERMVKARTAEAESARYRTQLILDSSADGIISFDREGRIELCNPAALTMLGYSLQALLGRNVHEAIHHSHADGRRIPIDECAVMSAIGKSCVVRSDRDTFWNAEGRPVPVSVATHPIVEHGACVGGVMSFQDISDRLKVEAAREEARLAAERLARMKSEFLANMSHEIRTPLNGVLGLAQIGYRDSAGDSKTQKTFRSILDSGKLLLTIINDILDFSKIEAGKLNIESLPFDPARLVAETLQMANVLASGKGLSLSSEVRDLPPACLGDPVRISQILLNLLSNATKFTESGSVNLTAERSGDCLVFKVCDTGIGISPEVLSRLFQPFEQADSSTTRRFGGTGLGLVICRRLAEMMNGALGVDSVLGKGSTFILQLPLRETAPAVSKALPETAPQTRRLEGLRVLVAEDNDVNQLVIEDILSCEGAVVSMVENGQAAVEAVARATIPFDAVLMDVQMPVMDGLAATRLLRDSHPALPIIGQTGHALQEEHDRCHEAGMVAAINKPIEIEDLVSVVLAHVRPSPRQASSQ